MRTCIATGEQKPKEHMVRFVIGPNDEIVPDLEEKLPGKGLWLSADRHAVEVACAKNLFARKARRQVKVMAELADRVEDLLRRRCLDLIRMARRAGTLTIGFDEVCRALESGQAELLIQADDAGASGQSKISGVSGDVAPVGGLTGDELGQAVDRERVVFASIDQGALAQRIGRELGRLRGMRPAAA